MITEKEDNLEIEKMEIELKELEKLVPSDHVRLDCTSRYWDGYTIYTYTTDDLEINWDEVTIWGEATATRPGALNPFKVVQVASISMIKLKEIKNKIQEDKKLKEEDKKHQEDKKRKIFEIAKSTGIKQALESYCCDCDDPGEECSTDSVTVFALPDGQTKTVKVHTW